MKVAVAQVGTPASWKPEEAIAKLEEYAQDAAKQGVEHIVFPEAYIGGYPKGSTFGAYVGTRTPEGRKEFTRYFNGAIAVPGPCIDQVAEISSKHRMFIVVGVIEREEHGGTLYCTAVFIHPDRGYVGKHRKVRFPFRVLAIRVLLGSLTVTTADANRPRAIDLGMW